MSGLPHHYVVSFEASPEGAFDVNADNLPALTVAPPTNFGGPGDQWSPEDLLSASMSSCLFLSFKAIANISKFDWLKFECECSGTLDKLSSGEKKNKLAFTHFETKVTLTIPAGQDAGKAEKLVHKAEDNCLISNSLNCSKGLTVVVAVSG